MGVGVGAGVEYSSHNRVMSAEYHDDFIRPDLMILPPVKSGLMNLGALSLISSKVMMRVEMSYK